MSDFENRGEVTALLARVQDGDAEALSQLFPLVEKELVKIARSCRRKRSTNHSVETMMLVDDVAQRILGIGRRAKKAGNNPPEWRDRHAFFAYASTTVMNILISWDRKRLAQKRGGNPPKIYLQDVPPPSVEDRPGFWVEIGEAIETLQKRHPTVAEVVRCRVILGMTDERIAEELGLELDQVQDHWNLGFTLLRKALHNFLTP